MKSVAAILLAAGLSRRMGRNKLLLPVEGEALVRRTAKTLLAADAGPTTIITGHEASAVERQVSDLPLRIVHNPDYASGLLSSVRAAVRSLSPNSDAALIVLADQIFLNADLVRDLVRAHASGPGDQLLAPSFEGLRGHPVLIPRIYFAELLSASADPERGAQFLFRAHADRVRLLPQISSLANQDLDTPADYARLLEAR